MPCVQSVNYTKVEDQAGYQNLQEEKYSLRREVWGVRREQCLKSNQVQEIDRGQVPFLRTVGIPVCLKNGTRVGRYFPTHDWQVRTILCLLMYTHTFPSNKGSSAGISFAAGAFTHSINVPTKRAARAMHSQSQIAGQFPRAQNQPQQREIQRHRHQKKARHKGWRLALFAHGRR